MATAEQIQAQLEEVYIPPLDSTTLLAISSEYDLTDRKQLATLNQILDALKATADIEGSSGFDPSGSSGVLAYVEPNGTEKEGSTSAQSHTTWDSPTDEASNSRKTSPLDFGETTASDSDVGSHEGSRDQSYTTELDTLDDEGKEAFLVTTFPALRPIDVLLSLKKHKGDTNHVIDDLLVQSFLEENKQRHKGVDGFEQDGSVSWSRKKGKRRNRRSQHNLSATDTAIEASRWDLASKDAQYIASRTGLAMETVTSLYHKHGASIRSTILAICALQTTNKVVENTSIEANADLLNLEFPSLPKSQTLALTRLTYPSTANAHELAKILVAGPPTMGTANPIQIEMRHTPLQLEPATSIPLHSSAVRQPLDSACATAKALAYTEARNAAFTRATAYYRKSKSDHMMGGVAAYYSQLGQDLHARAKDADIDAAEALVAAQSSSKQLDLHGVDVKNSVRISRERITAWWHDLGEGRLGNKGNGGFKIVTGVGNHSEGGKARVGPAVVKMLLREGWRVEVGSGALVVTGVTKRT